LWIASRDPQAWTGTVGGMETTPVLVDPEVIRDHLELIIGPDERARHGVWFALCDDEARPIVHAAVDDAEPDPSPPECEAIVTPFATVLAEGGSGTLLVAVTRPGTGTIGDVDRCWFRAVHAVCRRLGVVVLGVYLVTPRDLVAIQLDDVTGSYEIGP
jgi:hypothetical protein